MGDGLPEVVPSRRVRADRTRRMTVIYTVLTAILVLVLLQFVLLMAALEDFLSGHRAVLLGAAAASGACFAGSCWMIRYVSGRGT